MEYLACRLNPKQSTNKLHALVMPFFDHWVRMLVEPAYPKDLNYIALCRRLCYKSEDPTELLHYYINWANRTSSVKEELVFLFFERLRNLKYYPKLASPKMAEYVIAMDFRNYLKDRIVSSVRHPIDIPNPELTFNSLRVEDTHPDYLLLKTLGLDAWESYVLELLKLGMNTMEISVLTRLPRKTFAKEENQIWLKLKHRWQEA